MTNLNVANIELLASHLETTAYKEKDFSFAWNNCVAGHAARFAGGSIMSAYRFLGLDHFNSAEHSLGHEIFCRWPSAMHDKPDPRWAARTLRLFAKTGKVDWDAARFDYSLNGADTPHWAQYINNFARKVARTVRRWSAKPVYTGSNPVLAST